MSLNVLVTGGAGFIGSNLVHWIVKNRPSWSVTVVDSLTYAGNLENIANHLNDKKSKVQFVKADITDANAIEKLFSSEKKFDTVFHLAAESHVDRSIMGAESFVRTNALGTQILLDYAKKHAVKKFMHISTDEVYGSLGPTGKFFETTPLDPSSPYSASKAASDLLVLAYARTHGFPAIVTRCTNNYGPYHFPEKLIPLCITNAIEDKPLPLYGDGMNVRSWLFVEEHCEALVLLSEKGIVGEVYNIGGDDSCELPNRVVMEKILALLGKPLSLIQYVGDRPAHDRRYAVDTSKTFTAVGWKVKTSFDEGLAQTVSWYQKNQSWWKSVKSGSYREYYEKNYTKR